MNIVLMGPKHCGKSSVAAALSALFGFTAFDLDEEIEKRCGKSPRQLYREGAEIFREAEARVLSALLSSLPGNVQNVVIALGGGIVDNEKALALLKEFSQNKGAELAYLDIDAKTAWERINAAGELPPFLLSANPEETHKLLHARRAALYRQLATLTVEASGAPEEIGRSIMELSRRA